MPIWKKNSQIGCPCPGGKNQAREVKTDADWLLVENYIR